MNVLVLAEAYPMPGSSVFAMYIHTRNQYYASHGAEVTVVNFRAKGPAELDGIRIISWKDFERDHKSEKFDVVISHASNIKHHYRFMKKFGDRFPRHIFVFHGHEVLRMSKVYPPLFSWKRQRGKMKNTLRDIYDLCKLRIWKWYFEDKKRIDKTELVFVSHWMLDEFLKNTHTNHRLIEDHVHVIYNSVGKIFEDNEYHPISPKYDFVTIRQNIDGEKYCVDVVNKLANKNPQYSFLVVGRGELFTHIKKADNLIWEDRNLRHEEMLNVLNEARFALMPTKTDAQGLMMCEMATYGIPVVTSDIPVCHEALDAFDRVAFVSNSGEDDLKVHIDRLNEAMKYSTGRITKFFEENTSGKEWELILRLCIRSKGDT